LSTLTAGIALFFHQTSPNQGCYPAEESPSEEHIHKDGTQYVFLTPGQNDYCRKEIEGQAKKPKREYEEREIPTVVPRRHDTATHQQTTESKKYQQELSHHIALRATDPIAQK